VENKEPSFKELIKMCADQYAELDFVLKKEGYKARVPRAEWLLLSCCPLIIREDCSEYKIPENRLQSILNSKESLPDPQEQKTLMDWYALSAYRYGFEAEKLEKQLAQEEGSEKKEELKKRIDELADEFKSITVEERRRKQLAFIYQEKGERLERLYQLLEGKHSTKEIKIGLMTVHANVDCSQESSESNGFYEDMKKAYDFIQDTKGEFNFSGTTGIGWTDEFARAVGKEDIVINEEKYTIEAEIRKEGMKNRFTSFVTIAPIRYSIEQIEKNIRLFLPGCDYDMNDFPMIVGFLDEKVGFKALREIQGKQNQIIFYGHPSDLEDMVKPFLEKILV
jgi:hypothetical protein